MKPDKLVRMINEIARNLRLQCGDQTAAAVAEHLLHFWTPSMRTRLLEHASSGAEDLDAICIEAARLLQAHSDGNLPAA